MTISRFIFMAYLSAWLLIVTNNIAWVSYAALREIAGNAIIVSLFVGFGLNVNAFLMRNRNGEYRSLHDRLAYIKQHLGNVATFFVIPFCVSSASSIVVVGTRTTLVEALFGTNNYLLILSLGFLFLIAIPAAMVTYVYGWKNSQSNTP